MRTNTMLACGMAMLMAFGISMPARADRNDNPGHDDHRAPAVTEDNDRNETQAFQAWYGLQMRDYDRVDEETGERLADLAQMVVDVNDGNLLVTDASNLRRGIFITPRTQIFSQRRGEPRHDIGGTRKPTGEIIRRHTDEIFHAGDLIVAEGYLKVNGGIAATTIRVIGRVRGYGFDDDRPSYGYRAYGEVRMAGRGKIEVNTATGRRSISLEKDAAILIGGQARSLYELRRGDRIVFYARQNSANGDVVAYRVYALGVNDRYPDGDRPHSADPDTRDTHNDNNNHADAHVLEGRMQNILVSVFFNKMTLSDDKGNELSIRFAKSLQWTDRRGNKVSMADVRKDSRLKITYTEIAGSMFAQQIVVQ